MTTSTQWQLARESAERYQNILTPSILGPFARALVDFADLQKGEQVIDVGCGTGAAARFAAAAVGGSGAVQGLDKNGSMLAVAREQPPVSGASITWREADAAQLPLNDGSVDVVLCAQTLQFLPEKEKGLAEMRRVVSERGRVALSLWCAIEENPYFDALVSTIDHHIGSETAAGLRSAFGLTNSQEIEDLLRDAAFGEINMSVSQLDLPLPLLESFVPRHISATPMAAGFNQADENTQQGVVHSMAARFETHVVENQTIIPFRSHMILVSK
ncbi:MAG: methyltransferase domain-containing protein [Ardenticatenaceae bacterium]|nr:methyltransferase domain-containing protein [Ardenticatenaceae bacterium]